MTHHCDYYYTRTCPRIGHDMLVSETGSDAFLQSDGMVWLPKSRLLVDEGQDGRNIYSMLSH